MSESSQSSSEISAKIRSAIKAKLMELGAYVDDELPDYIMVMIANKKSKQQMADDLNLFLGKNSSLFTDWLQDVLDRLQSISRSSASAAIAQVVSQSAVAKLDTTKEEKNSSTDSTVPKEKERKRKKSPHIRRDESRNTHYRNRSDRAKEIPSNEEESDSSRSKRENRRSRKEDTRRNASAKWGKRSPHESEKRKKSASPISRSRQQETVDDDVLVLRAEIDEGDELAQSVGHENTIKVNQMEDQSKRVVSLVNDAASSTLTVSSTRKPIEAPSPDASNFRRRHVGTVRPMKRRTPSPIEGGPSRKRRSTVGQVLQRPDLHTPYEDGLDEEYDPLRPQINTSTALQSTVHVTERKYTVPREMQPKSSIFLRALNEANRSVEPIRRRQERSDKSATDRHSRIVTSDRDRDWPRDDAEGQPSQGVFGRLGHGPVRDEAATNTDDDIAGSEKPRNRLIQLRQSKEDINSKPEEHMETDSVAVDSAVSPITGDDARKARGPRFVVTMSGIDRRFVDRVNGKDETKLQEEEGDSDDMDTLIVDVNEEELLEEAMMGETDSGKSPSAHFGSGATPAKQVVNPIKISLEDDEDDDDLADRNDTIIVSTGPRTGYNSGGIGISSPAMEDIQLAGAGHLSRVGQFYAVEGAFPVKPAERCRFWPNCKLGQMCQYQHPTTNCKNFPQCKFGDKCLYIHPSCKFDSFCKNIQCPYFHSGSSVGPTMPTAVPRFPTPQYNSTAFIPCKFGGRCLNQGCTFRHPQTPCMYGPSCTKPTCAYSHRPAAPSAPFVPSPHLARPTAQRALAPRTDTAKFRWVAPQPGTSTTLSITKTITTVGKSGSTGSD